MVNVHLPGVSLAIQNDGDLELSRNAHTSFTLDTTLENSVTFDAATSPTDHVELAEMPGEVTSIVENAVPRSASRALISGFGLTGAAMRRRQRATVSYA